MDRQKDRETDRETDNQLHVSGEREKETNCRSHPMFSA